MDEKYTFVVDLPLRTVGNADLLTVVGSLTHFRELLPLLAHFRIVDRSLEGLNGKVQDVTDA